jgi:uncharacterized protein (TIGR02145 family)
MSLFKKVTLGFFSFFILITSCSKEEESAPAPYIAPNYERIMDIDSNYYTVVQIGQQKWMKENLRTTRYRNGDNLSNSEGSWGNLTAGAWAHYNNMPSNNNPFGKLYNLYAVNDSRGLCPVGWKVPNEREWNELALFLDPQADSVSSIQSSVAGGKMKKPGNNQSPDGVFSYWDYPNQGATLNEFSGDPGGLRTPDGFFEEKNKLGIWWSTNGSSRQLEYSNTNLTKDSYLSSTGLSVRCIKE